MFVTTNLGSITLKGFGIYYAAAVPIAFTVYYLFEKTMCDRVISNRYKVEMPSIFQMVTIALVLPIVGPVMAICM